MSHRHYHHHLPNRDAALFGFLAILAASSIFSRDRNGIADYPVHSGVDKFWGWVAAIVIGVPLLVLVVAIVGATAHTEVGDVLVGYPLIMVALGLMGWLIRRIEQTLWRYFPGLKPVGSKKKNAARVPPITVAVLLFVVVFAAAKAAGSDADFRPLFVFAVLTGVLVNLFRFAKWLFQLAEKNEPVEPLLMLPPPSPSLKPRCPPPPLRPERPSPRMQPPRT